MEPNWKGYLSDCFCGACLPWRNELLQMENNYQPIQQCWTVSLNILMKKAVSLALFFCYGQDVCQGGWESVILALAHILAYFLAMSLSYSLVYVSTEPVNNLINPQRACTARVTVLGLCVCLCVCLSVWCPISRTRYAYTWKGRYQWLRRGLL